MLSTFEQPLLDWLRRQDLTLRAWRDEIAATPDADGPLLERLEAHRRWLAAEIAQLLEMKDAWEMRDGRR